MFAVKIPGVRTAMWIAVVTVSPPGSVTVTAARPGAVAPGTTKFIWPVEANTPYSSALRLVPVLSAMLTVAPPSDVVSGSVAGASSLNPAVPKRLAISSGAMLDEISPAAFTNTGRGAEVLALKLTSPEYTATIGCPATAEARLGETVADAFPLDRTAEATIVLFDVSTNCTLPVGVAPPGETGATRLVRASWPETAVRETEALAKAAEALTAFPREGEGRGRVGARLGSGYGRHRGVAGLAVEPCEAANTTSAQ